jgi:serine/threonine protein kinase
MLGKVLNGRFTILETLGAGGMGRVYKAVQAPLDRVVALKVLNPNYGGGRDPGFQKRFFLEASMTSKLHHPNTITVIDYGKTEDGIFYIAMEFVEGQTLARIIAEQAPLPWQRCLHIAQQICRSLREAHKHGIIHRDLKPANVMVIHEETDHDLVKVLDFGLVKSFLPEHKSVTETELTQAGVLLGSPMYMAPEQARNHSDPRSDVYSLGVVFYQMLTGKPPFAGREAIDVILKHVNEPPPRLSAAAPGVDIPPEVEAIVTRCLAKKPEDRYQSMDEMLEAMRQAGAAVGMSGVFSKPRSVVLSQPRQLTPRSQAGLHHATRADGPNSLANSLAEADTGDTAAGAARTKRMVVAASFGGSAALGILVVLMVVLHKPASTDVHKPGATGKPDITAKPSVPDLRPKVQGAAKVHFRIQSEPEGARVGFEGRDLGKTPLELDVAEDELGIASALLNFSLDGYAHATATASGPGPEVAFTQHMTRVLAPPIAVPVPPPGQKKDNKKKTGVTPGYKDDPYQ